MKPPFGSHTYTDGYVPSWKAKVRRKALDLPTVIMGMARLFPDWFSIADVADAATGVLHVEHYRDVYAQRRVVAVHLLKLAKAGDLERRTGPGKAVAYRVAVR